MWPVYGPQARPFFPGFPSLFQDGEDGGLGQVDLARVKTKWIVLRVSFFSCLKDDLVPGKIDSHSGRTASALCSIPPLQAVHFRALTPGASLIRSNIC
jgi:hypothetical protein